MKFEITRKSDGKVVGTVKRGTPHTHESEVRKTHNDIMHGVKLKDILEHLIEKYGWDRYAF